MILVTGATGQTGCAVAGLLARRRVRFRALVEDAPEARAEAPSVLPAGTDVVVGDYERPDTLAPAMEGVSQVFLVAPGGPRLVAQETNVIEAAAAQGVRKLVKVSGLGAAADSGFSITRWHAEVERRLGQSGITFTILRPNFFMQNFLLMFAPRIAREGAIYAPVGDGRISMVDCRDLAAVAVGVLTDAGPTSHGAAYAVTGPEALTMPEAGEMVSAATGRPVRHVDLPPEEARRDMVEHGVREPFAQALLGLFAFFREGRGAVVTDVVERIGGSPPRTFAHFVAEHTAELGGAGGSAGRSAG